MKKNNLYELDIQLFANPPEEGSIEELEKDLVGEQTPPAEDPKPEEQTPPTEDPKPGEEETKKEDPKPGDETPPTEEPKPGEEEDPKKPNPMAQMRETVKERDARIKELEEQQKEQEGLNEKLFRAAQLGIKGESIEEVLEALEEHDVKKEAEKSGLTEEQIKKEKELEGRLKQLTSKETEMMFNQRAYNLQREKNLSEEDLGKFITDAANIGINLLQTGVDFKKIYERLNPEDSSSGVISEKDKRIAELEAENAKLRGSSVPTPGVKGKEGEASSTGDPALDKLLGDLT